MRRRGQQARFATLAAFGTETKGRRSRIGITVSAQVGGAVVRNRVRRRIRGALDAHTPLHPPTRILFVARPPAATEAYARLAADVNAALAAIGRA